MGTKTFLFVDQVGSTEQLTRLGDAAAQSVRRALFDTLRQATEVSGGSEVDFTGDGLFCAFDGAADAVDAAVAMQQLVVSFNARRPAEQHLGIRIGLNTGEPLESEGGGYFGAAVVVAARLCSKAEPGQILASGLVRGLVEPRGVHPFEPVGPLDLKGVPEPVETFAVGWAPDARRAELPPMLAARLETDFVGRAAELERIDDAWARTSGGGRALVLVSGDRGQGVSRLLAEAARRLRGGGASVWAGAGEGSGARLAAWAEAVGSWAAVTPRAELRLAVGERGADLPRLVPALTTLVPGLSAPAAMEPSAEVFLVADAVDELAARWSRVEPLVVVLDDLEEADPATLTVLRRLLTSRRGGRVLVLGGYEPSAVGAPRLLAALDDVGDLVDIRLSGLGAEEVARLVAAVTGEAGEAVGEATLRGVLAESEGSPYFVLQMARSMRERTITAHVQRAVDRAGELRTDLRLQREEIALSLRQLDQLREAPDRPGALRLDPDGTPPAPGEPPYKGLPAFQIEDADSFFGRDALVAEMVAALLSARWLAVLGPSGSGKSSAVRAGLLPALARGAVPGSQSWVTAVCTPGADPLGALGAALAAAAGGGDARRVADRLREEPLADVADAVVGSRRLVVVVDQFEELWTTASEADRRRTIQLLVEATGDERDSVLVIACMRADHYGSVSEEVALAELMAGSQVLVPQMTAGELRAAVEQPAVRGGWVLEPGLGQAVLDDVADEPGALPLLSTAMLETWQRRRGHSLTLTGYAETGGARRAIATLAEDTLAALPPAQQDVARRLLLRLAAPAAGGEDVARPASLRELVVDEDTRSVLATLAEARLVVVGATDARVAHEALLREWPRLRGWLESDREGRRLHQQIATAASDWETTGRDDGALLRGARLGAALDWRAEHADDATTLERDFLAASADAQQADLRRARRTTRRFQLLAVVLVVLLAGAAVAGGLAVVNGREATARANEATARGLASQAAALVTTQVDTALLLAVEAYRRDPSLDTESGLLAALDGARFLSGYRRELPSGIYDFAVSPDGSAVAVLTTAGDLQLFDTEVWQPTGEPLATGIEGPYNVGFAPDGQSVAWSDVQGVHVLDVTTGSRVIPALAGSAASTFGFGSDGTLLAVTGGVDDPDVRIVQLPGGRVLATIPAETALTTVHVRPGIDEILVVQDGMPLRRYGPDGRPVGAAGPVAYASQPVAFSRDGRFLAIATPDPTVEIHDVEAGEPVGAPLRPGGGRVVDIAFSPDGTSIAVAGDDGSVQVAEIETGFVYAEVSGVRGLPFIEFLDDRRLLAASPAETVEISLDNRVAIATTTPLSGAVGFLDVLPGADRVVLGAGPRLLQVAGDGEIAPMGEELPVTVGGLDLSPDGTRVAVVGVTSEYTFEGTPPDGELLLVDARSGEVMAQTAVSGDEVDPFASRPLFSPDGRLVAVGTWGGVVSVVDSQTGAVVAERQTDKVSTFALHWADDGSVLYAGGQDGVLRVLDPGTAEPQSEIALTREEALTGIVPIPGTDLVAIASEGGVVLMVDLRRQEPVGEPLAAEGTQLQALAVTPEGDRLVALSRDGALRIWDTASGRSIGPPLDAHGAASVGSAFIDDGRTLVTATFQGGLYVWDMTPDGWVERACELAGRDLTRSEWARYLADEPYRSTCPGD